MIRAHLATFPPRRRLLRQVVQSILGQVDHLFVVLNDYDSIPGFLAKDRRITAIIPDRDLKDAGKFHFLPEADDIVFTIDDDIGYARDYVEATLARAGAVGFGGHVFGYQGNAYMPQTDTWQTYPFHKPVAHQTGVTIIDTGTLCARGDAIAPLCEIEFFAGAVDHAYNAWLTEQGILLWVLPRGERWLTNILPHNLYESSFFASVTRTRPPEHSQKLRSFMRRPSHAGIAFADYRAPR